MGSYFCFPISVAVMASNKIQPIETLPLNGTVQDNDKIFLPEVGELPTPLDVVDAPSDLSVENANSDENHIVTVDNAGETSQTFVRAWVYV